MLLSNLNHNSLYVLTQVVKEHNMTHAAEKLGMTQSGVSQHITGLEDSLGIKLFIREKKKIIPTKQCLELFKLSHSFYNELESFVYKAGPDNKFIKGEIIIGSPIEFGNNILFPKLAKFSAAHPEIKFRVRFGLAYEMADHLKDGDIDFAFTDGIIAAKDVASYKVYQEQLLLCCSKNYFDSLNKKQFNSRNDFKNLKYITYLEDAAIVKKWFKEAMGYQFHDINSSALTEDAQGVLAFIDNGMGLGVIPKHMTIGRDDLVIFHPKKKTVLNDISFSFYSKRIDGLILKTFYDFIKEEFSLSSSSL